MFGTKLRRKNLDFLILVFGVAYGRWTANHPVLHLPALRRGLIRCIDRFIGHSLKVRQEGVAIQPMEFFPALGIKDDVSSSPNTLPAKLGKYEGIHKNLRVTPESH